MSSPLATLKKGSARAVPFRIRSEFPIPATEIESEAISDATLLDDVVNHELKKKDPGFSDISLMQSMIIRIQQLEKQVQSQAKEIIEKESTIRKLEDQVNILQQANDVSQSKSRTTELQAQCFILRKQVEQMEEFLADYGLIWVGDSDEEEESTDEILEKSPVTSSKSTVMPLSSRLSNYWVQDSSVGIESSTPNFELLLRNLKELNILAGEGQSRVIRDTERNEARLKPTGNIPLAIYINGLVLFDGPFRPYTDRPTRQLIVDILDGYFPSELQARYPEGVPFKVLDRREVFYEDKITEIFAGKGRRLRSADATNNNRLGPLPLERMATITSDEHKLQSQQTLTGEQFLNKLPKNIIANGKIVNVREEVANAMLASDVSHSKETTTSNAVQVVETKLVKELRERMTDGTRVSSGFGSHRGRPGTPRAGGLLVTLRVRSEDGSQTYVLKVRPSETVGDIRNYINSHRHKTNASDDYAIVQSFPKHVIFDNTKSTLEQCGLMSNAALFLRKNPEAASSIDKTMIKLVEQMTKECQT